MAKCLNWEDGLGTCCILRVCCGLILGGRIRLGWVIEMRSMGLLPEVGPVLEQSWWLLPSDDVAGSCEVGHECCCLTC